MDFIQNAGACMVTRSALDGSAPVRFLWREESVNPADNGWRIISAADTEDSVNNADAWGIADYNRVCEVEPLLISVYDFAVGSDLQIVNDDHGKRLVDTPSGRVIPPENYYVPKQFRA